MEEQKYYLLILSGIMCIHQILAGEAPDHLIRQKRVINLNPDGDVPLQNGDAPFVVNIRKYPNPNNIGVGAILSKHTVITVTNYQIASLDASSIKIYVGASIYFRGKEHAVISKNVRLGNHPHIRMGDGIALLTVVPAIVFNTRTSIIQLHQEPMFPGQLVTIFGWGSNPEAPYGTNYRNRLRSITVPIMNHRECVNTYRGRFAISDNDICTYDANKRCGHTDSGAPLVINNQLAGLHLWRSDTPGRIRPDVFVDLQSLEYATWIRNNIIYNVLHMRGSK